MENHLKIEDRSRLFIRVLSASNLKSANFLSENDVFVELRLKNETDFKRTRVSRGNNPNWNETFILYPKNIDRDVLTVKIYNQNYYVPDTLFGQFEVPLIRYISKLESGYNRLMNKIGTTFTPTQHNSELNMSVCLVAANAHPNSIPWFPQTFLGVQQQGSFSMPKQNAPLIPQGQNPYMNVAPVMPEPTYQQHHEMKQSQRNSIPPNAFSYTPNQSISQNVSVIPPQFQTQQSAHNPQYFHGMNQQQFETQQNQQQQSSFSNLYPTLEQNQFSPVNPSFK